MSFAIFALWSAMISTDPLSPAPRPRQLAPAPPNAFANGAPGGRVRTGLGASCSRATRPPICSSSSRTRCTSPSSSCRRAFSACNRARSSALPRLGTKRRSGSTAASKPSRSCRSTAVAARASERRASIAASSAAAASIEA
eukprot:5860072-Prymnesium_polylepis.1